MQPLGYASGRAAAGDPFSRADVDHVVRPERFTIEHPMTESEVHDANATVPQPKRSEAEARPMFLRTTSTARETTHRWTRDASQA
jgi:hypothetical protein